MPQCSGEFELHTYRDVGSGVCGIHGHADRYDVGDHAAGAAQLDGRTRRDGQAEHDVGFTGDPGEERGEGCDDHTCEGGLLVAGDDLFDGRRHLAGQRCAVTDRMRADRGRTAGEPDRMRQVADPIGPIPSVGLETAGFPVAVLVLDDLVERTDGERRGFAAFLGGGVPLGDAVAEGRGTESVQHDVVDPRVDEVPGVGDAQNRAHDEPVLEHVQRGLVFGSHPREGSRLRIGALTQVEDGRPIVEIGIDHLVGLPVVLEQPEHCGADFATGGRARVGERVDVEITVDVDVLGDGERDVAE